MWPPEECWSGGSIEGPPSLSAAMLFPVPGLIAGNHRSARLDDRQVCTMCRHATEAHIGTPEGGMVKVAVPLLINTLT